MPMALRPSSILLPSSHLAKQVAAVPRQHDGREPAGERYVLAIARTYEFLLSRKRCATRADTWPCMSISKCEVRVVP